MSSYHFISYIISYHAFIILMFFILFVVLEGIILFLHINKYYILQMLFFAQVLTFVQQILLIFQDYFLFSYRKILLIVFIFIFCLLPLSFLLFHRTLSLHFIKNNKHPITLHNILAFIYIQIHVWPVCHQDLHNKYSFLIIYLYSCF